MNENDEKNEIENSKSTHYIKYLNKKLGIIIRLLIS